MATFGYGRVSTKDQTTENQRMEPESAGYTLDYWFADEGVSGAVHASIALLGECHGHSGRSVAKLTSSLEPEDGMAESKCPSCESSSVERVRRWFWMRWLFRKRYRCNYCGSYMYEIVTTLAEQNQRPLSLGLALYMAMRTPLSAIAMGLHVLKAAGDANPKLASVTDMMTRQARHLKRLLKDLLNLARITRDRIELQVSATDIRECVQDAVEANRPLITQKAHVMTLDMPAQALMAEVDCTRIVEVVSNLLNNAAKYSPPGSSIKISLTSDEENVMISVKDDGLGIDAESLPKIFDALYANHEVDKAKAGLGIGLCLTRNLVELHAGTIVAKSEGVGRGSEFCVTIPLRH